MLRRRAAELGEDITETLRPSLGSLGSLLEEVTVGLRSAGRAGVPR